MPKDVYNVSTLKNDLALNSDSPRTIYPQQLKMLELEVFIKPLGLDQMNLASFLNQTFLEAMQHAGIGQDIAPDLSITKQPKFGHYQINGILKAAKAQKTNPRELAQTVVESLKHTTSAKFAEKLEISGPGFINIHLNPQWVFEHLTQAHQQDQPITKTTTPDTVVIDYSSPNLAKEMHVGHLRSTIIGDCIGNLLEALGHTVIRQNHVGDWGTQFGMLIAFLQANNQKNVTDNLSDLEEFYRQAKKRFDTDSDFADTARKTVKLLQSGDPQCQQLWEKFTATSLHHCYTIYQKLNIKLGAEHLYPESAFNDKLPTIVDFFRQSGLLQLSNGAQCLFFEDKNSAETTSTTTPEVAKQTKNLPPLIIQKSDGSYLYSTTDLAAVDYRTNTLQANRLLYVVDARQELHFKQIFNAAKMSQLIKPEVDCQHIAFGTMLGKDGKPFKTRDGGTIKLNDLLEEANTRALAIVAEKNPDLTLEEQSNISSSVAVNAIKYADLNKNRLSNYIFDWNQMLSFDGNTAPYLMYAYTRVSSIIAKNNSQNSLNDPAHSKPTLSQQAPAHPKEFELALKLLQFQEALENAAAEYLPNYLCQYLYELSSLLMSFYEHCPILTATESEKNSRLALCYYVKTTYEHIFSILGLTFSTRM